MIRRTKIVCTLGPASNTAETITALIGAGMDVARINASHGTADQRADLIQRVRAAATKADRPIAVLFDLQGPRIRVGDLATPIDLEPGQTVTFAPEESATPGQIPTTYERLANDVSVGTRILLDDGVLACEVTAVKAPLVEARVIYGGELRSHKGMNLPGVQVTAPALTDKDLEDAAFAAQVGADYVALSFVRRPEDLEQLKGLLPKGVRVIAKIEKDTALKDADRIIEACDAIMVARGDLGVELPFEEVPLVQKRAIQMARENAKPVIVATQMLDSMIENSRPTRAEASDVANAVLDGADALMLSAETAAGEYPVEAVTAMDRIIREIERQEPARQGRDQRMRDAGAARTEHAVAAAAVAAGRMLHAPLIVTFTKSGFTVYVVAAERPPMAIFAVTDQDLVYRQLALVWGVIPFLTKETPRYQAMLDAARESIVERGLAQAGDRVVAMAGVPFDVPGKTNMIKVEEV